MTAQGAQIEPIDFVVGGFHDASVDDFKLDGTRLTLRLTLPEYQGSRVVSLGFDGVSLRPDEHVPELDRLGNGAEDGEILDIKVQGLSAELLIHWNIFTAPKKQWTESVAFSFTGMQLAVLS